MSACPWGQANALTSHIKELFRTAGFPGVAVKPALDRGNKAAFCIERPDGSLLIGHTVDDGQDLLEGLMDAVGRAVDEAIAETPAEYDGTDVVVLSGEPGDPF